MTSRRALVPALGGATFLLAVGVYHKMLTPGWATVGYDQVMYFYPLRHYLAVAWGQHRLIPLWDNQYFLGVPFLANVQTAVLYPPNALFALLPTEVAMSWSMAIHIGLGGVGMLLYACKGQRLHPLAAAVSGVAYMLSLYLTAHIGHLNQNNTLAWTPWLMLAVDRGCARPGPLAAAAVAALTGLVVLAGHTQQAYFTALLALLAAVYRLWHPVVRRRRWRAAAAPLLTVGGGLLLGVALSAAQILPTMELAGRSIRGGGLTIKEASQSSLPLTGILGNLLPNYHDEQATELAGAMGAAVLALAALALVSRWRRPAVPLLALLAVLAIVVALGPRAKLYDILFYGLPGFRLFRVPSRVLLFSTVALALLAGHGAQTARQLAIACRRPRWRRRAWSCLGWAAALSSVPVIAVAADLWIGRPGHSIWKAFPTPEQPLNLWLLAAFTAGALALAAAPLALTRRRAWMGAAAALPLLVAADLFLAAAPQYGRHPLPASLYHQVGAARSLVQPSLDHRYLSLARIGFYVPLPKALQGADLTVTERGNYEYYLQLTSALAPNVGMGENRLTADGYDGGVLPTEAYVRFRSPLLEPGGANPAIFTDRDLTAKVWNPAWLLATGTATVLESGTERPDVGACCMVRSGASGPITAWRLAGAAMPSRAWVRTASGRVPAQVTSDTGERVEVRLPATGGGSLVLADSYYPGWTATVDGRPAAIQPYEGFMRQVVIPAGAREVVFDYRPSRFYAGLAVSLVALLVVAALALVPLAARRRRAGLSGRPGSRA